MTMSGDDADTRGVQRFEVFTGAGKRREWPPEIKAEIIAESYSGRETVSAVARRHGLAPSQLFTWRRGLRKELESKGQTLPSAPDEVASFVPAVIEPSSSCDPAPEASRSCRRRQARGVAVELEIDGVAVRIGHGADADVVTAVITALKATR